MFEPPRLYHRSSTDLQPLLVHTCMEFLDVRHRECATRECELMWNPDRYRDCDYGLGHDDSFEPGVQVDEAFVPVADEPYIQTVLGPISPENAGITLVGEHLYANPAQLQSDQANYQLTDREAALVDLETFFTVGGRTIVDTTSAENGRSTEALVWLAQHAPVNIVASSGVNPGGTPDNPSATLWLKQELTEGLDGTTAKPGLLTCAMQNDADSLKASFRLAAEYQRQTGLPVMLRERAATAAFQLPEAAIEKGIAASQLVVRSDSWSKFEARADDIVQLGSYLLVDGLGDKARGSDLKTAALVARLVEHGHRNQILLSHGFDRRSLLTGYDGRPGYGYIIEQFAIMLLEAGVAAPDVRVMLVDNCASALSVQPHGSELDA